jgi:flagellar assembly protein FliH
MKRRLNLSRSVVVPWEIPDIAAAGKAPPGFLEMELGRDSEAAKSAADGAKRAGATKAAESVAETSEPRAPQGHDEGFKLGLQEGRDLGFAEGVLLGRQAADLQFAEHLQRLDAVVRRLGEPVRALERPVEEAVIALALEVARWVIGSEISRSRDHLLTLIRDAVSKVPLDVGTPMIVLNPGDAQAIRDLAPDLESNGIALIADETMELGGCRVVATGAEGIAAKDRRWHPRALQGICEVDLTLASRWRDAMFAMFEGEDA